MPRKAFPNFWKKTDVLEEVARSGFLLQSASTELRADREVVLTAVRRDGRALEYASDSLRADKKVVLRAVGQSASALQYASESLRTDICVVTAAVRQAASECQYRGRHPPENTFSDIVFKNRERNSFSFLALDSGLNANKDKFLEVVKIYGRALQYANDQLKADKDIVLAAVEQDGTALKFADCKCRADRSVVLRAVRQNGDALACANDFRNDPEIVCEAVRQCGAALTFASEDRRADKEVVLEALKSWGDALSSASESLRSDREVVLEAVKTDWRSLRHASEALRTDKDLVLFVARRSQERNFPGNAEAELSLAGNKALLRDQHFHRVQDSGLAVQGEEAPIISVHMSRTEGDKGSIISCKAWLMSGDGFSIDLEDDSMPGGWLARRKLGPTVNDLTTKVLENLPTLTKVKCTKRVFINLLPADDGDASDAVVLTPWDLDRPLTEFLPAAVPVGTTAAAGSITIAKTAFLDGAGEAETNVAPHHLPSRCIWRCLVPSFR